MGSSRSSLSAGVVCLASGSLQIGVLPLEESTSDLKMARELRRKKADVDRRKEILDVLLHAEVKLLPPSLPGPSGGEAFAEGDDPESTDSAAPAESETLQLNRDDIEKWSTDNCCRWLRQDAGLGPGVTERIIQSFEDEGYTGEDGEMLCCAMDDIGINSAPLREQFCLAILELV